MEIPNVGGASRAREGAVFHGRGRGGFRAAGEKPHVGLARGSDGVETLSCRWDGEAIPIPPAGELPQYYRTKKTSLVPTPATTPMASALRHGSFPPLTPQSCDRRFSMSSTATYVYSDVSTTSGGLRLPPRLQSPSSVGKSQGGRSTASRRASQRTSRISTGSMAANPNLFSSWVNAKFCPGTPENASDPRCYVFRRY